MTGPLANRTFRHLFAAQILSLLGSGLATVALSLLAFELAGGNAGAVLGTALFLKMVAYVGLAPLANAVAERLPRRAMLVTLDLIRAAIALCLPFVTAIWQIYVLILALQAASAAFTPAFQASIPDVLEDEGEYTHALSFSRLAYDLESLISPMLAAALLLVIPFHGLFAGTALGFAASAFLVIRSGVPPQTASAEAPFLTRATRGVRLYLATPRLRGLLALNLAVAAAGAMVLVNTVVLVRDTLGLGETDLALTLAAYGVGSMGVALSLPRWLDTHPDRGVMLAGGWVLTVATLCTAVILIAGGLSWPLLLVLWAIIGAAGSAVMTPSARLLRRSVEKGERPAIFTAQFTLSHACWLIAYPLAGLGGVWLGLGPVAVILGCVAAIGALASMRLWTGAD